MVVVATPVSKIINVTFNFGQISLSNHGLQSMGSKNTIKQNWLKKFIQVEVYVTYMHANFIGIATPVLEILLTSNLAKFPFQAMDIIN